VPEIVAQSGARLVDVGTTNRTRRADYEQARAGADVALVLKVHPSNFRVQGFTADVSVGELAGLGVPVVHDLGSGLLDAACPWLAAGPPAWLRDEPAARQSLAAGATAVTFSGDKLLGGPQAGVVAGSADVVAACAAHPLARALRPGALVLGALQEVALAYLRRDGDAIPFWRLATIPVAALEARAHRLGAGTVVVCESLPGAGSLPGVAIPSAGIAVDGDHTTRLRAADPPVIARVADGRTVCDLRAVDPVDDAHLAALLHASWPS
jgi:L-seryl-tRNA(Ser) seleniumtransferase